jgi:uncharacterized membrane protein YidH (DUF202 family)
VIDRTPIDSLIEPMDVQLSEHLTGAGRGVSGVFKGDVMIARHILLIVGLAFLLFGVWRLYRERWHIGPAARTWLLVGVIFVVVSTYLSR